MSKSVQTIEQLKHRFDELNTEKVRLQTRKERAEQDLEKLRQQATEQFGTADLKELQKMLSEIKESNEKMKLEYQQQLEAIEKKLLAIDNAE